MKNKRLASLIAEKSRYALFSERHTAAFLFILLHTFLISLYLTVLIGAGFTDIWRDFLIQSPDSPTYSEMGLWLLGMGGTPSSFRPFFYPLILGIMSRFGSVAVICFQGLLWIGAVNCLSYANFLLGGKRLYLLTGFSVAINPSLIVYSFQVLSETLAFFLLSAWYVTYALSCVTTHKQGWNVAAITLMSAAAVTRPVFLPLVFMLLIATLFSPRLRPRSLRAGVALCLLSLSPVIIQLVIFHHAFGVIGFSEIGTVTFRLYYLPAYWVRLFPSFSFEQARSAVSGLSNLEILALIFQHPTTAAHIYLELIVFQNILAPIGTIVAESHPVLISLSALINRLYAMCLLALPFLILLVRIRRLENYLFQPFIVSFFLIGCSGISFWQGDRLVAPGMTLAVAVFLLAASMVFNSGKSEVDPK